MKLKKLTTSIAFILLGLGGLHAQETTAATGGESSGTGGTASYTIGQVVYTTATGANGSVAQGVQQPYEISVILGIEVAEINLGISAYPNPTTNLLTLKIGNYGNEKLTYQLYDLLGRLLDKKQVTSNNTTIIMERLPNSTYFLKVSNNKQFVKSFKIIKN